ncbi:HlyD family efflux transporter periplasmic adaptor subunit [Marinobacter sp. TBZ242]|uniref:HlyD family efflux transporter periplasmic adaptor subunit n=1 Tax=Marinobacter azerbaijanicus TaxID=3050455 RepID=A0ABT7IIE2_9GAMM|nr:HlyD family efflux transporter periplasmic adaptor subunit [Marinobacter sp. TBZ242]MDL0433943.1 HlyD family efflux transporter periplasmic adaptor subunit [Marinobacter sp. TBZ242]
MRFPIKTLAGVAAALIIAAGGYYLRNELRDDAGLGEGFASGNGRIEATEIDVATKLAGRVAEVLVVDGDFVAAGQVLARMQVETLEAQRDEAMAQHQQALNAVLSAEAQVALRESDRIAAQAVVAQRESELDAARRRLARSEALALEGASSAQELDDDRARVNTARAAVAAARAQVDAARSAIEAARAQVTGAHSSVAATRATITRIEADIRDSELTAPRAGRVQFRVAQPGEVLGAGGRVLNLIDLADVYMTFFLPSELAGRIALGSEARIVLDAAPDVAIPARVTFVASSAQFTPKTVETASERQKLMFRVRAQIDRELLQRHLEQVKTGLPGVAWVKLDAEAEWPAQLFGRVLQ